MSRAEELVQPVITRSITDHDGYKNYLTHGGQTIREDFAKTFMSSLISDSMNYITAAKHAVKCADQLIAELEKTETKENK